MTKNAAILRHILEDDAEDDPTLDLDIKELLRPSGPFAGQTQVTRFGRWKLVDMFDYTFLISYLTPVAYLDKRSDTYYKTTKQWSPTTNGHVHAWAKQIWKSPEWQADESHRERGEAIPGSHWVRFPVFQAKSQREISALFRELMETMKMKPRAKQRLYHVDPQMRQGSRQRRHRKYLDAQLKIKDTGEEGLPKKGDDLSNKFLADFTPDQPEYWDWDDGTGRRSREPHERGE